MRQRNLIAFGITRRVGLSLLLLVLLVQPNLIFAGKSGDGKLSIVILEGNGAVNNVRQRVAREVVVQIKDENDRPLAGAAVIFKLPGSGASGAFSNSASILNVTTDAAGRAVGQFTPNGIAGSFQVNVTASFENQAVTTAISQTNMLAPVAASSTAAAIPEVAPVGGISAATVAVVAAAVVAAAAVAVIIKDPPTPTIRLDPGTPVFGAPDGWQKSRRKALSTPRWKP